LHHRAVVLLILHYLFFYCSVDLRVPHSFPTRRSSDLDVVAELADPHRRELRVHVVEVLLERPAAHAVADDVDERQDARAGRVDEDRKSTRLNSSHVKISYAVFCLKKKIPNCERRNTTR